MLHYMRNILNSDNIVRRRVLDPLRRRLPPGWRLEPSGEGAASDLRLVLRGPGGERAVILVEIRNALEPKDAAALVGRLQVRAKPLGRRAITLACVPFLTLSARQRLTELGVSYLDLTGNIRLTASRPALYIEAQGAEHDPNRRERPARSLKGGKAGRVVRALCDRRPPFEVRRLGEELGIDPGYVSRVFSFLGSEDLIVRERRGPVTEVRWRKLIERWARDYSFLGSNRVVACLEPRGLEGLTVRLCAGPDPVAVTGAGAAASVAPVAPTRLLAAYVASPEETAERLGLRPAESGANVLLAEPYDPVVFERSRNVEGVPYVALSQAAADLLGGPGRGPSEAQALLDWMEAHEPVWRR